MTNITSVYISNESYIAIGKRYDSKISNGLQADRLISSAPSFLSGISYDLQKETAADKLFIYPRLARDSNTYTILLINISIYLCNDYI